MNLRLLLPLLLALTLADAAKAADGFVPLFNGHDLTGWVNANCAPETWSVSNGVIHCTGHPTGALRTPRHYENFILELDWRHLSSGGNSGIFIWGTPIAAPGVPFLRAIEVQVLDNGFDIKGKNEWYTTHGDVFPIHGSTMNPFGRHNGSRSFPSEERSHSSPEWNHYRITGSNGVLRLEVNGKEVSGGEACNYRKGYLGLESEGAPVEFRNIRIRELPSTGADASVTAPLDQKWHQMFTGLDLRGWRTNTATAGQWAVRGERLFLGPPSAGTAPATLWSEKAFGRAEFVLDCRTAQDAIGVPSIWIRARRDGTGGLNLPLTGAAPGRHQRFVIRVDRHEASVQVGGGEPVTIPLPRDLPGEGLFGVSGSGPEAEFMNFYVRPL